MWKYIISILLTCAVAITYLCRSHSSKLVTIRTSTPFFCKSFASTLVYCALNATVQWLSVTHPLPSCPATVPPTLHCKLTVSPLQVHLCRLPIALLFIPLWKLKQSRDESLTTCPLPKLVCLYSALSPANVASCLWLLSWAPMWGWPSRIISSFAFSFFPSLNLLTNTQTWCNILKESAQDGKGLSG